MLDQKESNWESGDDGSSLGSATDLLHDLRQAASALWALLIHPNKEQFTSNLECFVVWYEIQLLLVQQIPLLSSCREDQFTVVNSTCKLRKKSHLKLHAFSEKIHN